nr:hypothetical protein [Tanacetum cinerariifolium]
PEWNTHVVVWMNKADIEIVNIDDLYNNFKIVEQDIKKSVGASTGAQNIAFLTAPSTSSTNDVNTANPAYEASTDLEQIHEDDLGSMDLRECKAQRNQDGNNEDIYLKAMMAIDGVGFDLTDMAEEQVQTNIVLMAFSDSELNQTKFTTATYKRGLATIEEQLVTYKKNEVLFSEEVAVLKKEVACKDYEINVLKNDSEENFDDSFLKEHVSKDTSSSVESSLNVDKETDFSVDKNIEFVKPKHHDKLVRKSVWYAKMYRLQSPRGNQRNWNGQKSNQLGSERKPRKRQNRIKTEQKREACRSRENFLKQLQWVEEEKLNKTQKEWPKTQAQSKAIQVIKEGRRFKEDLGFNLFRLSLSHV